MSGAGGDSHGPLLLRSEFKFNEQEPLGSGSYSKYFKGTCRGTVVVVKKNTDPLDQNILSDLQAEISTLRDNPHPNIVQCMGVCIDGDDVFLVAEYCNGGTLEELLHSKPDLFIPMYRRMDLASQIAKGLAWIHGTGYLHRDLKPANIYLSDSSFTSCKIGDFGVALSGTRELDLRNEVWAAPEKCKGLEETPKSDVYSFAIILWECYTRERPILTGQTRPLIPESMPETLHSLLTAAWAENPAERPAASEIASSFPEILVDVAIEDPKGREFWKEMVGTEFALSYSKFLLSLFHYWGASMNNTLTQYFLSALPHASPSVVQAHEYGAFLKRFGPMSNDGSVIVRMLSLFEKDWFWPDLSTEEAQQFLQNQPDGTFLVRYSSTQGAFTLTRVHQGRVAHRRITYVPTKQHFVDPTGKIYPSLDSIIREALLGQPLKELGKISRIRHQKLQVPTYEDASIIFKETQ